MGEVECVRLIHKLMAEAGLPEAQLHQMAHLLFTEKYLQYWTYLVYFGFYIKFRTARQHERMIIAGLVQSIYLFIFIMHLTIWCAPVIKYLRSNHLC